MSESPRGRMITRDYREKLDFDFTFLAHRSPSPVKSTGKPAINKIESDVVADDPLGAGSKADEEPEKKTKELGKYDDGSVKVSLQMSYVLDDSEMVKPGSKIRTGEMGREDLDDKDEKFVYYMEHTDEWYYVMDMSFILSDRFNFVKESKGIWWGNGTNRTLVLPSVYLANFKNILQGTLKIPDVTPSLVGPILLDLYKLVDSKELIVLDCAPLIAYMKKKGMTNNQIMTNIFDINCVDMERRCEACQLKSGVICRCCALVHDPMVRMRLSGYVKAAIANKEIARPIITDHQTCWCPAQKLPKNKGVCDRIFKGCRYAHHTDLEKIEFEENPQCPTEIQGYPCSCLLPLET